MELNTLTAISPIDGRYRKQVHHLEEYFSEFALMKYRVQVEIDYFLFLADKKFFDLSTKSRNYLKAVAENFSPQDAQQIKETEKIRVGAVSYLNTRPLICGFEQGMMKDDLELVFDYPSRIASMLVNDEIDLGLVPVVVIPKLKNYHIITDYCIGADGPVASVCLFSESPLHKVEKILLDYQSRTSVALTRLLCKEYWKINPEIIDAGKDFRDHIQSTTAGLVIGDRALEQRKISPHNYTGVSVDY